MCYAHTLNTPRYRPCVRCKKERQTLERGEDTETADGILMDRLEKTGTGWSCFIRLYPRAFPVNRDTHEA